MSWKTQTLPAKFRGIPFVMQAHDGSGGRRLSVAEVPGGDDPIIQDLGASARFVRVDAILIGDDVFTQRDNLLKALQVSGPGLLVHPWLGQFMAYVKVFSVRESNAEGGLARFSIEFARYGTNKRAPSQRESRAARVAQVVGVANSTEDALTADFAAKFTVAGAPGFVSDAAVQDIQAVATKLEAQASNMGGDISSFILKVRDLADTATAKAADPLELANAIQGSMRGASSQIGRRGDAIRTLLFMAKALPKLGGGRSPRSRLAQENNERLSLLVAGVAFAEVARRAVKEDWPSWDSAKAMKERIVNSIDEFAGSSSLGTWRELHGLQAEIAKALPGPRGELPELRRVRVDAAMPALVLAYKLHGNLDNYDDIVARNSIPHPLFVPPAQDLEVLSVA